MGRFEVEKPHGVPAARHHVEGEGSGGWGVVTNRGRSQVTDPRCRHPPKPHPPRKAQSEEGGGVKKGSERKTKVTRSAVHTENQKTGTTLQQKREKTERRNSRNKRNRHRTRLKVSNILFSVLQKENSTNIQGGKAFRHACVIFILEMNSIFKQCYDHLLIQ